MSAPRQSAAARYVYLLPRIREMAADPNVSKRVCHETLKIGWDTLGRLLEDHDILWVSPSGTAYATRRGRSLAEKYADKIPEIRRLAADPDMSMQDAAALLSMRYNTLRRIRTMCGIEWQYDRHKPHKYRGRVTRPRSKVEPEQVEANRNGGLKRRELSRDEVVREWLLEAMVGGKQ